MSASNVPQAPANSGGAVDDVSSVPKVYATPEAEVADGSMAGGLSYRQALLRYAVVASVALTLCGLDLATKYWVFDWLGPPHDPDIPVWWIWEGYFGFQTALNQGALFGLGQGYVWLFALFSVLAVLGISYWLVRLQAIYDWGLALTLALVLGGILGNLYDRLGLWTARGLPTPTYAVRDWILCQYGQYVWPNFNLADSYLVCGAALLAWRSITTPQE